MQKRHFFSVGFIALALVAGLLVINSSGNPSGSPEKAKPTCCKKDLKCAGENKTETPVKTDLENLSHQFIFVPATFN